MGKHSKSHNGNQDDAWNQAASGQQKADEFDELFAQSQREAQAAQAAGEYPYDLDARIRGK